jgi:hypothetical protein
MNELCAAWDARIERLLARLPASVGSAVTWLREPSRHLVRFGAGILLVLGGIFSILPVLGIWMLPLGLALLAEDMPGLKPRLERSARWCERRWRAWRGEPDRSADPVQGGEVVPARSRVPDRVRPPSGA